MTDEEKEKRLFPVPVCVFFTLGALGCIWIFFARFIPEIKELPFVKAGPFYIEMIALLFVVIFVAVSSWFDKI